MLTLTVLFFVQFFFYSLKNEAKPTFTNTSLIAQKRVGIVLKFSKKKILPDLFVQFSTIFVTRYVAFIKVLFLKAKSLTESSFLSSLLRQGHLRYLPHVQ